MVLAWALAAVLAPVLLTIALAPRAAANEEARLIEAKVGLHTLSPAERSNLWKRVDEWATADSLLDFCGKKLNIYKRGWNAVTACVETPDLRKVGGIFRNKRTSYIKILEEKYAAPEQKKAFCDGLAVQLKDYARIINAQIDEAAGMCRACLIC